MDHKDKRWQPCTRVQQKTNMDNHRQESNDQVLRQNMEEKGPTWSLSVKPILVKVLRTDEYETKMYPSIIVSNHRGGGQNIQNFENNRNLFFGGKKQGKACKWFTNVFGDEIGRKPEKMPFKEIGRF